MPQISQTSLSHSHARASLQANMFASSGVDMIYWPIYRDVVVMEPEADDTNKLVNQLGYLYTVILWLTFVPGLFLIKKACCGGCLGCCYARQAYKRHMAGEASRNTGAVKSKTAQASKDKHRTTPDFA